MTYEFELTDDEFRRAWLAEYFRRPGAAALRVVVGMVFLGLGIRMATGAPEATGRAIGIAAVVLGIWHLVRPFVMVRAVLRHRRESGAAARRMRVRVGSSGVAISDGQKETEVGWDSITAAGRGKDYVWFEVRGSARGTIPLRAVGDEAALIEAFRERGKWR